MTYVPHYLSVHSNNRVRGYIALLITGRFSPVPHPTVEQMTFTKCYFQAE